MSRIKTKNLKSRFQFRVYDEDEFNLLTRAIEQNKDKFYSLNDLIKYFALVGADKMIGDHALNQSINFSEIRRNLESIDNRLENIEGEQRMNFIETKTELLAGQAISNLNTNLLRKSTGINLNSYTPEWKYSSHNEYELEKIKNETRRDLLNGRK